MARTDTLPHFLTDVADAIRTKKGTNEAIVASNFDTEIESLPSGGDPSEYFENTLPILSTNLGVVSLLKKIPFTVIIPSSRVDISGLFSGCYNLTEIPNISYSSNITNINSFYYNCGNLTTITLDTNLFRTVQYCQSLFCRCSSLTTINNINSITMSSIKNFYEMFYGCSSLTSLNLSNWNPTQTGLSIGYMFNGCSSLTHLDMRKFMFTNTTNSYNTFSNVPANCEIIVKNDTQKNWFTTNFSWLTNVKTLDEYQTVQATANSTFYKMKMVGNTIQVTEDFDENTDFNFGFCTTDFWDGNDDGTRGILFIYSDGVLDVDFMTSDGTEIAHFVYNYDDQTNSFALDSSQIEPEGAETYLDTIVNLWNTVSFHTDDIDTVPLVLYCIDSSR